MSPLPDGWSPLELVDDVTVADGLSIHRSGVASIAPGGEEVTGSAADTTASPSRRAQFELFERAATLEALADRTTRRRLLSADGELMDNRALSDFVRDSEDPARYTYARSNGVALHRDWSTAALRARCELAERDRLLRSWAGGVRPEPIMLADGAFPVMGAATYEWRAAFFPEPDPERFSVEIAVAALIGFPRDETAPLVFGFAGRPAPAEAIAAAAMEATQLLAFLWGEPVPERCPDPRPDPTFHLDYFQLTSHRPLLRGWLDGEHARFARDRVVESAPRSRLVFIDITPDWLGDGMRVAKAICPGAMPLTFGASPGLAHLPEGLRIHPVA